MATAGSLIRKKMLERQLNQREICHAQEHASKIPTCVNRIGMVGSKKSRRALSALA